MVEAAALQRVVQLARAVRGDDDERVAARLDRAQLRDRDLEVGEELEQEGLELVVGAVDLVDQEHHRRLLLERVEQRALEQELAAEEPALGRVGPLAARLGGANREQLALIVPVVERLVQVDPLVTLEADQPGARRTRQRLGHLGLANPGLPLDEQGLLEGDAEEHRRCEGAVG